MRPFFYILLICEIAFLFFSCEVRLEKVTNTEEQAPDSQTVDNSIYVYQRQIALWQDGILRFCCNGKIFTSKQLLDAGKYEVSITARGTVAYDVYPTIKISLQDSVLQEFQLIKDYTVYKTGFELSKKDSVSLGIEFDQDGMDDKGNDRDVFIRQIKIKPAGDSLAE